MDLEIISVNEASHGKRIDIFLARELVDRYSRSQIQKNIENGSIRIKGRETSAHSKLKTGDEIEVEVIKSAVEGIRAEDIPVPILYEDEEMVIVSKPAGMVVHPAYANPDHTLVNALLFHFKKLSASGTIRPGLVHRLDKDTSGVMVIAKNDHAHAVLARQFKNHTVEKVYYTFVRGVVQHDQGVCEDPVGRAFLNRKKVIIKPAGGKEALTFFHVKKRFRNATWLEVHPKTGRTHQIRVHMAHMDHPVIGDILYGVSSPWINRQALHAFSLTINHPSTGERLRFESSLPEDMQTLIRHLESNLEEP